ncbi:NADP-dependent oxidoreductase domain-containing protein [Mycena epipterygia]|nr:NADP-dependent oxidoreductase domain-containing protein [Mycena epipterygia]
MSNKVAYRQVGKSGLRVSVPILGGMSFGSPKWKPWVLPEDKGLEILKAAWDLGINTFDSANMYSNGESERIIAEENVVIITKSLCLVSADVAIPVAFDPSMSNTRTYVNQGGLSRAAIFNQLDASLARLETTDVDRLRALHDLVVGGRVRYLGASNLQAWQLAEMNHIAEMKGWTQFTCMQIEHSLLYRPEAQEKEIFAYCKYKGIGVVSYSPLANGHLARPFGAQSLQIIKRVEKVAEKYSLKMGQIALAWSSLKVTSPVVGVNTPERVHDTVLRENLLSDEDVADLEEL